MQPSKNLFYFSHFQYQHIAIWLEGTALGGGKQKICVAGGGSWGTALAHLACQNGHEVTLYLRDKNVCAAINESHENVHYLPGLPLHPSLTASTDPGVLRVPIVVLAVPCQQQRSFVTTNKNAFCRGVVLVNAAKGIEDASGLTASQFLPALLAELAPVYTVLSGPSFAKEVLEGQPTAVVIASDNASQAACIQHLLSSASFRCYTSTDVLGVEIGGAVKNVIAIAAGLCDGLDIGTNGRAALLTRGLAEITRLGVALGAKAATFMGLSGLGDLVLTATGNLSRNRTLGLALGQGKSLEEATREIGMVTEGVKTAFAVSKLARRLGVSVPITSAVCAILDGTLTAREASIQLMSRSLGQE